MVECNKEGVNVAGVMGRSLGMEGTGYSGMSAVVVSEAREASGVLVTGAAGSVGVIVESGWVRKFKNTVVGREGEGHGRGVDGLGEPGVIVHLDVEGRL